MKIKNILVAASILFGLGVVRAGGIISLLKEISAQSAEETIQAVTVVEEAMQQAAQASMNSVQRRVDEFDEFIDNINNSDRDPAFVENREVAVVCPACNDAGCNDTSCQGDLPPKAADKIQ